MVDDAGQTFVNALRHVAALTTGYHSVCIFSEQELKQQKMHDKQRRHDCCGNVECRTEGLGTETDVWTLIKRK